MCPGRNHFAPGPRSNSERRGVILLIVVVLLALFATIGLTFVLYANSQAEIARVYREAQTATGIPPDGLFDYFLNQLLFDVTDDPSSVGSALRGHSLMRGTYGLDYDLTADGVAVLKNNTVAYNGTGRLHHTYPPTAPPPLRGQDDYSLINYTHFSADRFLRDPERFGYRAGPAAARGPYAGAANPAYSYPDLNTVALAAARADGTLMIPSFHRPWLFGPLDPSNPNWTSPEGKYKLLRPRPAEHPATKTRPGFPFPDDATGDVKNLIGAPGGNDSVWLDLGYPVLTTRNGRQFKPLFAALVLDLDGRLNVNTHGNVRGTGASHASNQGWGPWEVNLSRVITDGDEYAQLFVGTSRQAGRHGANGVPGTGEPATNSPNPSPVRVDYDGVAAGPMVKPHGTASFPTYPAGWDNAAAAERAAHPSTQGRGDDHRFAASNMELLLRAGDTGAWGLTSELLRLFPRTLATAARRMVTTDSADLDRPGAAPWFWGPSPAGTIVRHPNYPLVPDRLLGGGPKPFPATIGGRTPPNSDFDPAGGRSLTAALGRIDLSRPLPEYPRANRTTGQIRDTAGFVTAQSVRQNLAAAIYERLIKVTGAYDPTAFLNPAATLPNLNLPTPPDVETLRWLAQLAVNMVDYMDPDDCATPFNWGAIGSPAFAGFAGGQWVFGTELPRVVINEVYGEYLNDPNEVGERKRATHYRVNVWVELHNPLPTDATRLDAYQLLLTKPNAQMLSAIDGANVLGDPDGTQPGQVYHPEQVYRIVPGLGPATVAPGGFCVLGPPPLGFDAAVPVAPTAQTDALSYVVPVRRGQVIAPPPPQLLLRRLACPGLPWQPDPRVALYNPYVTVDFVANVSLNRGATNTGAGHSPFAALPIARRASAGRREPYDGRDVAFSAQSARHTLFAHNDPREPNFRWLVHLDRPPISPVELFHVSACKPHQLTHMFRQDATDAYQPFRHAPYWLAWDDASPLYRLFEFLDTGTRAAGATPGGRVPGKINLNAVWDQEVFLALCDAQAANGFHDDEVKQLFHRMMASRSPGGTPGPNDRPFKGLAAAHFTPSGGSHPDGAGLADTLLRSDPTHPLYDPASRPIRLFEIARPGPDPSVVTVEPEHPYQRFELLTKIFNNVTTRSHVFAVWLTVGFFEVTDATTVPPRLGEELGRAEGRHVRHRMFAIVDRSQPVRVFPAPGKPPVTTRMPIPAPGPAVVSPSAMGDTVSGAMWQIRPGVVVQVTGPGPEGTMQQESVVVTAAGRDWFAATFTGVYPKGLTTIQAFGNPGPRAVRRTPEGPALAPHVSIIQ